MKMVLSGRRRATAKLVKRGEKDMHYEKVSGILNNNGMNLYRGCTHGCIYCDSRSTCYQINHDFEDVLVKENAIELLEIALKKKRKKCMIGTGSMTDPYCHAEDVTRMTRKSLELIYKYGFGVNIITKSTKLLNDLDLLKKINKKTKAVVDVTLTTYDENLCKIIEPNVSTTKERYEMLKILRDNHIPTIVWLCPILPFINDTEENISGILNYCIDAKVHGILCFGMGLTLRDGDREYFYKNLDKHFVGLKEKYTRLYGNQYSVSSPNHNALMKIFRDKCRKNNIETSTKNLFEFMSSLPEKTEQLTLF